MGNIDGVYHMIYIYIYIYNTYIYIYIYIYGYIKVVNVKRPYIDILSMG